MKTLTCNNLGGACDKEFKAETWEEMVELSKQHGMEMMQAQDPAHLKAMEDMKDLMKDPAAMGEWFESKKKMFADLPHS